MKLNFQCRQSNTLARNVWVKSPFFKLTNFKSLRTPRTNPKFIEFCSLTNASPLLTHSPRFIPKHQLICFCMFAGHSTSMFLCPMMKVFKNENYKTPVCDFLYKNILVFFSFVRIKLFTLAKFKYNLS